MATGRKCTICFHANHEGIDRDLLEGKAYRYIALRNKVSIMALSRHMRHLLTELAAAKAARDITIDTVMQDLLDLRRQVLDICAEARGEKNNDQALRAIGRATKLLEVRAEILGQIKKESPAVAVQVNILENADFKLFQQVLFRALGPYKEARLAVARGFIEQERLLKARGDAI